MEFQLLRSINNVLVATILSMLAQVNPQEAMLWFCSTFRKYSLLLLGLKTSIYIIL